MKGKECQQEMLTHQAPDLTLFWGFILLHGLGLLPILSMSLRVYDIWLSDLFILDNTFVYHPEECRHVNVHFMCFRGLNLYWIPFCSSSTHVIWITQNIQVIHVHVYILYIFCQRKKNHKYITLHKQENAVKLRKN